MRADLRSVHACIVRVYRCVHVGKCAPTEFIISPFVVAVAVAVAVQVAATGNGN